MSLQCLLSPLQCQLLGTKYLLSMWRPKVPNLVSAYRPLALVGSCTVPQLQDTDLENVHLPSDYQTVQVQNHILCGPFGSVANHGPTKSPGKG